MQREIAVREEVGVPLPQIVSGVLQLAESYGRHVTEATFAIYAKVCGSVMRPSDWDAVVAECLENVETWPSTATLLRLLRERHTREYSGLSEAEIEARQVERDRRARASA